MSAGPILPPDQDPRPLVDDPDLIGINADDVGVDDDASMDPAPAVAFKDRPWTLWAGIAGAVALGGIVFSSLLAAQAERRTAGQFAQVVDPDNADPSRIEQAEPPALFPPSPPPPFVMTPPMTVPENNSDTSTPAFTQSPPPPPPPPPYVAPYVPPPPPPPFRPPEQPAEPAPPPPVATAVPGIGANPDQRARSPTLVIDLTGPASGGTVADGTPIPGAAPPPGSAAANAEPSRARRLTSPATTIPQGAMIAAVLETGINSDLPGFVRAVVSRDIRSFDGSRILIPRGSRLVGEYTADVALGQSRALVVWNRVIRPDGVSILIVSPGTDPVGRAGLSGRVDRHLWQRYGPGILLTAINGALRNDSGTQVVLGGATNALPQAENIKPTVTVEPGTAIQVFVSRDLDFAGVSR